MKPKSLPRLLAPARPRTGRHPDYSGDRGGLVRILDNAATAHGLQPADVTEATGISTAQLSNIRKGRAGVSPVLEEWARAVGLDLSDESIINLLWTELQDALVERLTDSQRNRRDKVLFLDDLIRNLEKDVPTRVEPIFDFVAECISRSPRPVYVVQHPSDFPPVGSNPYLFRRRR